MANILFDRRHLREYLLWGALAGLAYSIPVLVYLSLANYYYSATVFIGSILFMLVILLYTIRLTKRRPEYKSTWMMIIAGNMVVLTGIIISVLLSFMLCLFFIPEFLSGHSPDSFMKGSPDAMNINNAGTLMIIAITATLVNFGVGGVISILVAYAVKLNQTKDRTPGILNEPAKQ